MKDKSQKPTIEVERRRPGSRTPSAPRERAEAPARRREGGPSGDSPGDPSFPGGGVSGGSPLPGMANLFRSPLGIVVVILLLVCCVPIYLLMGGQNFLGGLTTDYQTDVTEPAAGIFEPTPTRRPTLPPAPAGEGQTWTVMLYQDADDKILEQDIL